MAVVSEADRNEVLEELVEPLDIAGRVGRKVARPLDGSLKGGICPAFAVWIPPASGFENYYGIRRRLLASKPTGDGRDLVGNIVGIDVT